MSEIHLQGKATFEFSVPAAPLNEDWFYTALAHEIRDRLDRALEGLDVTGLTVGLKPIGPTVGRLREHLSLSATPGLPDQESGPDGSGVAAGPAEARTQESTRYDATQG